MKIFSSKKKNSAGWEYAGLGFEFSGMFLACTALGWWLDSLIWPTKQWFMLGGIFLGFGAGLYHILLRTSQIEANSEPTTKPDLKPESNSQKIDRLHREVDQVKDKMEKFISEENQRNQK